MRHVAVMRSARIEGLRPAAHKRAVSKFPIIVLLFARLVFFERAPYGFSYPHLYQHVDRVWAYLCLKHFYLLPVAQRSEYLPLSLRFCPQNAL